MQIRRLNLAALAAGLTAHAATTSAGLLGDDLTITGIFSQQTPNVTVVDPGIEHNKSFLGIFTETIDVFDTGFTYQMQVSGSGSNYTGDVFSISGVDFADAPLTGLITDVQLISGPAAKIADISFSDAPGLDSGAITVTFANQVPIDNADMFRFNVVGAVPEPASLSLLAMGAAALLTRRR